MGEEFNPVVRISDLELKSDRACGRYVSSSASIGLPLNLTRLGARLMEVPPGKTVCPFHVHLSVDELFFILSGTGEYRFGDQRHKVGAGDALGAPIGGAEVAHQLVNTGDETLRYLAISSKAETDICLYPDTGKFAVFNASDSVPEERRFRHVGRPEQNLDYFDGDKDAE